ncbi:hypothetical protein EV175_004500 [Coemansia sp. RSA 1933]|nr:hypothetical protein EV175_004500 [Coemansia sp. RSA 1933]
MRSAAPRLKRGHCTARATPATPNTTVGTSTYIDAAAALIKLARELSIVDPVSANECLKFASSLLKAATTGHTALAVPMAMISPDALVALAASNTAPAAIVEPAAPSSPAASSVAHIGIATNRAASTSILRMSKDLTDIAITLEPLDVGATHRRVSIANDVAWSIAGPEITPSAPAGISGACKNGSLSNEEGFVQETVSFVAKSDNEPVDEVSILDWVVPTTPPLTDESDNDDIYELYTEIASQRTGKRSIRVTFDLSEDIKVAHHGTWYGYHE